MYISEVMSPEQVSLMSVPELVAGQKHELGEHCLFTPPLKSCPLETQCWMAPLKPARRSVMKLARAENGEIRVMRDRALMSTNGLILESSAAVTNSPLRYFSTLQRVANEVDKVFNMGHVRKAMALNEADQFPEETLRFCPSFERRQDDDDMNTCKRRADFKQSLPFMFPAHVRH